MPEDKISICLTTQRFDILFKRAVDSIEKQSVQPDEVVLVVDNLSSKLSNEKWFRELPSDWNVYWTENEDSGPTAPRNQSMYYATGDWLVIVDGDDILVPSCLETYKRMLPHIGTADVIAEITGPAIIHHGAEIKQNIPQDRNSWSEAYKQASRSILSGKWKKGEFPLRPFFIKNRTKKFYPSDFMYLEDKVLLLYYILEERKVVLSDYCGYVMNIHTRSLSNNLASWGLTARDENRFRKIAANTHIQNWVMRDNIFNMWRSYRFLTYDDLRYIEESVKYYSFI